MKFSHVVRVSDKILNSARKVIFLISVFLEILTFPKGKHRCNVSVKQKCAHMKTVRSFLCIYVGMCMCVCAHRYAHACVCVCVLRGRRRQPLVFFLRVSIIHL